MNDHSNCNHSHLSKENCIDEIDTEKFQPVRLNNTNDIQNNENKYYLFLKKWIYVITIYILFGLFLYFSFTVRF